MNHSTEQATTRLMAFVGTYGAQPGAKGGGIYTLSVENQGVMLSVLHHEPSPVEAGYLVYSPIDQVLYAVDERKTDGRGPVSPPAAVHALAVSQSNGKLSPLNWCRAPGPRPTFLSMNSAQRLLISASHGDFQHVEKVVQGADGNWVSQFVYDDATIVVYRLEDDGSIKGISDVLVLSGHGLDPNKSPQNGGHAQASPHAHCAVIDPSGKYLLICDKGTDRVYVYTLDSHPEWVSTLQFPEQTAPRHIAFSSATQLYLTLELSSEVAVLELNPQIGELSLLSRESTTDSGFAGFNEPAEIRVHPNGKFVYVNNRGEDSLAWFEVLPSTALVRRGAVPLEASLHPGVAARSFSFSPCGTFMLVADRPAHQIRAYSVSERDGSLTAVGQVEIPDPAYIEFAELPSNPAEHR